jgi:hypothetical protein
MFHNKPFKKDLTPFAKGGKVVKHIGKGAKEQSRSSGGMETMTGGDPFARMSNRYPKPSTQDLAPPVEAESAGPPPPVPMGSKGGSAPSAMMPGDIGGGGDEEE